MRELVAASILVAAGNWKILLPWPLLGFLFEGNITSAQDGHFPPLLTPSRILPAASLPSRQMADASFKCFLSLVM